MHGGTALYYSGRVQAQRNRKSVFERAAENIPSCIFPLVFLGLPIEYKARYEKIFETIASSQHLVTASLLGPVYKSIPLTPNTPHQVLCGVSSSELLDFRTNLKNQRFAKYLSDTSGIGRMVDSSIPLVSGLSARRAVKVASYVEDVAKRQEDGLGTLELSDSG
jgi:hypothetical protein